MKFLKSKFFIICVAIVLAIALLSGVFALLGFTGPVKAVLGTIAKPFQLLGSWAANGVNGFVEVYDDYEEIRAENDALRAEIDSIKNEKYDNELLREENEWLKGYIKLATDHPSFKLTDAKVIARESDNYSTLLTLNRGSVHGVKVNMPVITEDGVLGRVCETGLDWCKVVSLLDPETSVGAYAERTGASGIVDGDPALMGDGLCSMGYIDSDADIRVGDRIFTSGGSGSSYPTGLYIGEIVAIDVDVEKGSFTAKIKPAVEKDRIDSVSRVMIVTGY